MSGQSTYAIQFQSGRYLAAGGSDTTKKVEEAQTFSRYVDAFNCSRDLQRRDGRVIEIARS